MPRTYCKVCGEDITDRSEEERWKGPHCPLIVLDDIQDFDIDP